MTWNDTSRRELMGLLDEAGQAFLGESFPRLVRTLRTWQASATSTFASPDELADFDAVLASLLRLQGVRV